MAAEYVSVTPDPTASANDASSDASVSSDGRLVAFASRSTDLVPGFVDTNGPDGTDVFVRDVATGVTTLVSHGGGPAAGVNGSSDHPAVSADGRFVVFESLATDLPTAGSAAADVFRFEVATGTVVLVSRTPAGQPGNDASTHPAVSADGRYVAFETLASDLGPGGGRPAVLVRDTLANTTMLASVWGDGTPIPQASWPSISDDGQRVAFVTAAADPGGQAGGAPDANGTSDVYLRDLAAGSTRLVSRTPAGTAGNGASELPAVSGNGQVVAFQSDASDLAGDDALGVTDVFAYDVASGAVALVSATPDGTPGDGESTAPSIAADGRSVAFVSQANDLLPGSHNQTDVYVRDLAAGQTIVVGGDVDGGITNGSAAAPALSADGRWVAFESIGTRLDPDTTESGDASDTDVFLTPRVAATPPPQTTPTDPAPDLLVLSASRETASTPEGAPVTTTAAEVSNAGDVDAGPFDVRFALSLDPVYDDGDPLLAVVAVPGLAAGATVAIPAGDPPAPTGLAGGNYYIVARADAGGAVVESAETNNDAASAVTQFAVAAGPATPGPGGPGAGDAGLANLVAEPLVLKLKSQSVLAGSKAPKASLPVTNAGDAAIDVVVAVRVVASADGVVDAGDADVATLENVRVKLKAGRTKALKLALGTFPAPPDGDYYLLAEVDSQNVLDESNEQDNVGATASPVTIAAPFVDVRPLPGGSLGAAPATVSPGGKLSLKVTLNNPGNVVLKALTEASLSASADAVADPSDVGLTVRPLKLNLKPGQTKTFRLTFVLPDALPTDQNYFLILQLDASNAVGERDETDNVLVADNATTTS